MTVHERHYVRFFSPGTFVKEESQKAIESWDVPLAVRMSQSITERHGATPFGFEFTTQLEGDPISDRRGGVLEVVPKQLASSGVYFLGGEVKKFCDIPETRGTRICRDPQPLTNNTRVAADAAGLLPTISCPSCHRLPLGHDTRT